MSAPLIEPEQQPAAETFATRLRSIESDLASIVDRMNRDRSYEKAGLAQSALHAVAALSDCDAWFDDLEWQWQPGQEEE